jgi:inhibitor of KinA
MLQRPTENSVLRAVGPKRICRELGGPKLLSFEGHVFPLGDTAVVIELGKKIDHATHEKVKAVAQLIDSSSLEGMVEYIPAFTTVTVIYDPLVATYDLFSERVQTLLDQSPPESAALEDRRVDIPVRYGGDFGPDLDAVASHTGLSPAEVIAIHGEPEYLVYMIGFAPGFPYLGGMSERLVSPRRQSPRAKIPAGSVGIAGGQTGVYPIETPGGWQLIGRTPLRLFRPELDEPSLLRTGDLVRFRAIEQDEYEDLLERDAGT